MNIRTLATTLGLTALLITTTGASAQAVDRNLIDVLPAAVQVAVPAPGHSERWSMTVNNVTDQALPLGLDVLGDASALFAGDHPLSVTVTDAAGQVIVPETPAAAVIGQTFELPDLPAGATYTVHGSASLPRDAGNEYAGVGGELTFRYTSLADELAAPATDGGGLALTGGELALTASLTAALLATGACVLLRGRRTQKKQGI